jgi:hypothetical protein
MPVAIIDLMLAMAISYCRYMLAAQGMFIDEAMQQQVAVDFTIQPENIGFACQYDSQSAALSLASC